MQKFVVLITMIISAFLAMSCTASDSATSLENGDAGTAELEIVSPAFVLFYTEN
ncbi:MAG: hypothetical protein ACI9EW_001540 [Cellvibrionaceae bacterium]|jgi:hypothetical protein